VGESLYPFVMAAVASSVGDDAYYDYSDDGDGDDEDDKQQRKPTSSPQVGGAPTTAATTAADCTTPLECTYCSSGQKHPYFAYMITINDEGKRVGRKPWASHIGLSRNPIIRLPEQNRKSKRRNGSRSTGYGAPYWQIELAIGPFINGGGRAFVAKWKKEARKLKRITKGILLAEEKGLIVYHKV
jgi:hypothetical protein